jgi:hypothetical protein
MGKLSWIFVAGLLACVLAVLFRDDFSYRVAYDSLHSKRAYFDEEEDEEEDVKSC